MAGISVNTPSYVMYGAGTYVTVGNVDVGALAEGESVVFSVEMEVVERVPLGARGPIVEMTRIRRAVPILTFTVWEITAANLAHAFSGLGTSAPTGSTQYGSGAITDYAAGDYKDLVVTGMDRADAKVSQIHVINALMEAVPEMSFGDANVGFTLVFRGHYETTATTTFPAFYKIET